VLNLLLYDTLIIWDIIAAVSQLGTISRIPFPFHSSEDLEAQVWIRARCSTVVVVGLFLEGKFEIC
jgi:hypothetical protein